MREKFIDLVLGLEEKYCAVRKLVPVKDKQLRTGAEDLLHNEPESDGE